MRDSSRLCCKNQTKSLSASWVNVSFPKALFLFAPNGRAVTADAPHLRAALGKPAGFWVAEKNLTSCVTTSDPFRSWESRPRLSERQLSPVGQTSVGWWARGPRGSLRWETDGPPSFPIGAEPGADGGKPHPLAAEGKWPDCCLRKNEAATPGSGVDGI